jgi:hypothetical protein
VKEVKMTQQNNEPDEVYVASVRTALSGPENNIMKKLPKTYQDSTIEKVLDYLTDQKQLQGTDVATARSIKEEMKNDYTVSVNGATVKKEEKVGDLFVSKEHKGVGYKALDIEVASVQEGGLVRLIR